MTTTGGAAGRGRLDWSSRQTPAEGCLWLFSVGVDRRLFRLPAALHEQGHQTDAVNGQDEEDRDLYAGTAFVFLLQSGALWNEWILVVHFQLALLRLFIEVLVEFVRFAPGFCLKKPRSKIVMFSASLHCCAVTVLPFMLGVPPADTPTY